MFSRSKIRFSIDFIVWANLIEIWGNLWDTRYYYPCLQLNNIALPGYHNLTQLPGLYQNCNNVFITWTVNLQNAEGTVRELEIKAIKKEGIK